MVTRSSILRIWMIGLVSGLMIEIRDIWELTSDRMTGGRQQSVTGLTVLPFWGSTGLPWDNKCQRAPPLILKRANLLVLPLVGMMDIWWIFRRVFRVNFSDWKVWSMFDEGWCEMDVGWIKADEIAVSSGNFKNANPKNPVFKPFYLCIICY